MRTIRTNDTTNGGITIAAGGGAAGVTTAQVQTEIDTKLTNNGVYQLISSTNYPSGFGENSRSWFNLIETIDYDTVFSYKFVISNPGHGTSGNYRLVLGKDTTNSVSGTTYVGYQGFGAGSFTNSSTSYGNGEIDIDPYGTGYSSSDNHGLIEIEYFINDAASDVNDQAWTNFQVQIWPGYYSNQSKSGWNMFSFYNNNNDKPNGLSLNISAGTFDEPEKGMSNLTVYQKKRPTATTA